MGRGRGGVGNHILSILWVYRGGVPTEQVAVDHDALLKGEGEGVGLFWKR